MVMMMAMRAVVVAMPMLVAVCVVASLIVCRIMCRVVNAGMVVAMSASAIRLVRRCPFARAPAGTGAHGASSCQAATGSATCSSMLASIALICASAAA